MGGLVGFIGKSEGNNFRSLSSMIGAIKHRGSSTYSVVSNVNQQFKEIIAEDAQFIIDHFSSPTRCSWAACAMGRREEMTTEFSSFEVADTSKPIIYIDGYLSNKKRLGKELKLTESAIENSSYRDIILQSYHKWELDLVHHLSGTYVIFIYDPTLRKIYLIKDHFGMKPIFYFHSKDIFAWSSEIKGLLSHPEIKSEVFLQGLVANYYLQATPQPHTCFKNILSVKSGCIMTIDIDTLAIKEDKYWTLPLPGSNNNKDIKAIVEELEFRIKQSVHESIEDAPHLIGTISAGIDSSTVMGMVHQSDSGLKAHTFGFDGKDYPLSEIKIAKEFAEKKGINQLIQLFDPDIFLLHLEKDLAVFESPYPAFETGQITGRFLSDHGYQTKISGLGPDEILGGYGYYLKSNLWSVRKILNVIGNLIPEINSLSGKIKNKLSVTTAALYYAKNRWAMRPYEIKKLISNLPENIFEEILSWLAPEQKLNDDQLYNQLFHLELIHSLGAHHSAINDMSGSQFGIQNRYPYLDASLVNWIASLDLKVRYDPTQTKYLLRQVAAKYIPSENLHLPKQGFGLPMLPLWNNNKLFKEFVKDKSERLKKRTIFKSTTIDKWMDNVKKEFDTAKAWQLVTTEVWLENYIDS